jgi:hypothetical protein
MEERETIKSLASKGMDFFMFRSLCYASGYTDRDINEFLEKELE